MSTKTIKRTVKKTVVSETLSPLGRILSKDKQLQDDKQRLTLFLSLSKMFDEDLEKNLYRTSFELDELYTTYDTQAWLNFLNYPPVRRYIEEYIEEKQSIAAKKALAENALDRTMDALNVQKNIEEKRKVKNNSNIIVFLMPQKRYKKVTDFDE